MNHTDDYLRHKAKLVLRKDFDDVTAIFEFLLDDNNFNFVAGQYVWIILPQLSQDQGGDRRAFSIFSPPSKLPNFQIIMRHGHSTFKNTLWQLNPGETVSILGPFGYTFTLKDSTATQLVMLASGVGLAPFLSTLRSGDERWLSHQVKLIHCQTPTRPPLLREELIQLDQSQNWLEVTYFAESYLPNDFQLPAGFQQTEFWIAGPPKFVNHTAKWLKKLGVTESQCKFENFYPILEGELTESSLEQFSTPATLPTDTQENPFFLAVMSSTNHTVITDTNGGILFANPAAEKITGYKFSEMRGQTPRLWGGLLTSDVYTQIWSTKQNLKPFQGEVINHRKNGELYTALAHISPILNRTGKLLGYVATEEDISPIKAYQQELDQKNQDLEKSQHDLQKSILAVQEEQQKTQQVAQRLQLATSAAKIGVWEWEVAFDVIKWDGLMYEIYHNPNLQVINRQAWESLIYPEDLKAVQEKVDLALQNGEFAQFNFRAQSSQNKGIFLHHMALIIRDESNRATRMIGVAWDVTKETEVDRMKSEFISMVSHQLRTPLSTIRWYCELLGDSLAKRQVASEEIEYLDTLSSATQRMIELVNGLLNISRIEMGTFSINPTLCRIQDILKTVLADVEHQVEQKKAKIQLDVDQSLPPLNIDQNLTHIVMMNLLTNAIKYSHEAGVIEVEVRRVEASETIGGRKISLPTLLYRVTDHGIGIPGNQQANMFTKTFRAQNARAHENDGDGLGMYLVKAILDEAGGEIWFESVENQGTTFYVTVPLSGMKQKAGSRELDPIS